MNTSAYPFVILGWLLASCAPERPGPSVSTESDDPAGPDPEDSDTPVAPARCAIAEVEPNPNPAHATVLPLERRGCGELADGLDIDVWAFTVPTDGWLAVRTLAYDIGSRADIALNVAGGPDAVQLLQADGYQTPDPSVLLPLRAGHYNASVYALLADRDVVEGADNTYEILVSLAKPPGEIDLHVPANTSLEAPLALADGLGNPDGLMLYGVLASPGQRDVLAFDLPAGPHEIRVEMLGLGLGSPLATLLQVYDATGALVKSVSADDHGLPLDPELVYDTSEAGRVRVAIVSSDARTSAVHWYLARVKVGVP